MGMGPLRRPCACFAGAGHGEAAAGATTGKGDILPAPGPAAPLMASALPGSLGSSDDASRWGLRLIIGTSDLASEFDILFARDTAD